MKNDQTKKDTLFAHSSNFWGQWQTLQEHLENVADLAQHFAERTFPINKEVHDAIKWLAFIHDLGKASPEFQSYISIPHSDVKGPDHSSFGGVIVSRKSPFLSMIPACHHSGLPNRSDFKARISNKIKDPKIKELLQTCSIPDPPENLESVAYFLKTMSRMEVFIFIKMLFSILVDADFLDTEYHYSKTKHYARQKYINKDKLIVDFGNYYLELIRNARQSSLNSLRNDIFTKANLAAQMERGFFGLTAPTGSGKTLAYINFALQHMKKHNLDRIIIVLPYTSIVDQIADLLVSIFGEEAVVEHSSSINFGEDSGITSLYHKLSTENWDAPIIVTTTVQFFDSLFSNRPSKSRKIHNIANSVIVLDEFQALPATLMDPTVNALKVLQKSYGCSILRTTATMCDLSYFYDVNEHEINDDKENTFKVLKRVEYHYDPIPKTHQEIASSINLQEQTIVIFNTINDCLKTMEYMPKSSDIFHLSTNMCPAHRKDVLNIVGSRLRNGLPVTLMCTQVIEAGIDIDFKHGIRILGPLDNIVQAAGRVNREGLLEIGRMDVWVLADGKMPIGTYMTGTNITRSMLSNNRDINSPRTHEKYFMSLFNSQNLDEYGVLESIDYFNYENVGRQYRIIRDDTVQVIVAGYGEVSSLLSQILAEPDIIDWSLVKKLNQYKVNMWPNNFNIAYELGLIHKYNDMYVWVGDYSELTGLDRERINQEKEARRNSI